MGQGDFYQKLGVDSEASSEDIKKAYKQKALKFHPDTNPDKRAQQQFQEINEAYQCLKDPQRRAAYDALRGGDFQGFPHGTPGQYSQERYRGFGAAGQEYENDFFRRYKQYAEEQERRWRYRRRTAEEEAASRAAWEREKAEAQSIRERSKRQYQRTVNARHERTAKTLRKYWHTSTGVTWQDAFVLAVTVVGGAVVVATWPVKGTPAKAATSTGMALLMYTGPPTKLERQAMQRVFKGARV